MKILSFGKDLEILEKKAPENSAQVLLHFDSGKCVSFEAALLHLLILGTTGSGKTASAVRPALLSHFMAGHGGIILDIKGNIDFVRAIAKEAGRQMDTIELGTLPSSMSMNLLAGMDVSQCYDFFLSLMNDSFNGESHNMDFHVKGVGMARDMFRLMQYLQEVDRDFAPNILTINEMFNNPPKATEVFEYFVEKLADPKDAEQQDFIDTVRNSQFHVLTQTKKKLDRASSNHFEQLSYNTHSIKNALKQLLDVPGITEKFFRHGAPPLDMDKAVAEGKIIVTRFSPDSGAIGARLGRTLLNRYYEAIYKRGTSSENPQTFVCIDEFQEVADLSDGRFSDTSFIAQAREFRSGFIGATQSAAALLNRGASAAAVEAFVSNCNSKISFFSDDPFTRELAKRYDPALDLIDLKPGQAFVVGYDAATREHFWGLDSLQGAFESTRDLKPLAAPENPGEGRVRPPLREMAAKLQAIRETRDNEKEKPEDKMEKGWESEKKNAAKRPEPEAEPLPQWMKDKYAALFTNRAAVRVPVGWRQVAAHALDLFMEMDLGARLHSLTIDDDWNLRAVTDKGRRENDILNALLEKVGGICMVCGGNLEKLQAAEGTSAPDDDEDNDYDDDGDFARFIKRNAFKTSRLPVCKHCLARHSLADAAEAPTGNNRRE